MAPRLTEYTELQQLRNNHHQAAAGTRTGGRALLPICVLSFLKSGRLGWVWNSWVAVLKALRIYHWITTPRTLGNLRNLVMQRFHFVDEKTEGQKGEWQDRPLLRAAWCPILQAPRACGLHPGDRPAPRSGHSRCRRRSRTPRPGLHPSFKLCSWNPRGLLNPWGYFLLHRSWVVQDRAGEAQTVRYLFKVGLDFVVDNSGNRRKLRVTEKGALQKSRLKWNCAVKPSMGWAQGFFLHPKFLWQHIPYSRNYS